ncbi:MAG TPA: FAD-dependent oxidoreductase [Aquabacterium sp.]|uniref:flavin monoamine oxidase family protein n=1 Tax=Aquabacterium sp. TaxID=1872578 RepID=UPI002E368178|nr:FAD-dependent oxidoreductase [Aquabacterium sp.]HEX5371316.1 FAD-dependent oxidoreductase [Aquabacterium sp.]
MSDRQLSRRRWLSGVTASAAAATVLGPTSQQAQAATTVSGSYDTDVVVVGAGYSGLACARALVAAGKRVMVLEARGRVGGRCVNSKLPAPYNAFAVEAGAEFLGPTQTRMYELCSEFGIQTYRTYNTGKTVNYTGGMRSTYSGLIPLANLVAASEGAIAILRLDAMAKTLPIDAPWQASKAIEWDNQTFQTWIDRNILAPNTKDLLRLAILSLISCEPREVSLLFVLNYIRASGSLQTLLGTEGGGQQDRVVGGSQLIALAMAQTLGDRIYFNAPVQNIEQDADGILVSGADFSVRAKQCVVATSPWIAGRIAYDGELSGAMQQRMQLMQRMPMGTIWKVHCVYDRPFWRDDGLNGQVTSDKFITKVTFDNTPSGAGAPGVMMGFIDGIDAVQALTMTQAERRAKVLEAFTTYFGAKAANPLSYLEHNWQMSNYSGGGPTGIATPGTLTAFGPCLRRPVGRLHWAGTETSTVWLGYMEGAVRAGERAARDIIALG